LTEIETFLIETGLIETFLIETGLIETFLIGIGLTVIEIGEAEIGDFHLSDSAAEGCFGIS
jgi:hypothetical protein